MKTLQIGKEYHINSLTIVDVAIPALLPGQVLVNIKAVALNYRDRLVVNGIGLWKPPLGRIPASDGMGIVTEVGESVKRIRKGDRVAILFFPYWQDGKVSNEKIQNPLGGAIRNGTLQEFMAVDENEVVQIPFGLSNEEAATLPCAGLTAWNGLIEQGNISKDSVVLIQGTGGVSLFSLQFALMSGATTIVLSGSDEKLERIRQLGGHYGINYKKTPDWEERVLEITDGKGADHIVEVVGGNNINRSMKAAAAEGTISAIGLLDGLSAELDMPALMRKQLRILGVEVGSKAMFCRMIAAIEKAKIHPVIDKIFDFPDFMDAFTLLGTGQHFGKICIRMQIP